MKKRIILSALITMIGCNILLSQSTSPVPYCVADFDDAGTGQDVADAIDSVSFGTLMSATNAQFPFPHYVFYNNLPISNFIKGNTYILNAVFDVHGGAYYGVWIDYNQNSIFEISEKVSWSTPANPLVLRMNSYHAPITQSITIPASASTGPTRMRVRIVEDDNFIGSNGGIILACNTSTSSTDVMDWGETEDYTINITASSVGIDELSDITLFSIYPNPASTALTLDQTLSGDLTYKIVDLTARVMQAGTLSTSEKRIPVTSFSEGIYILQLFSGNESLGQQKFIKTSE